MSYRKKTIKTKLRRIKPKKSVFKNPVFWCLVFIVLVAGAAAYFLIFYPYFQVQNIFVSGAQKVNSEDIKNIAYNEANKKFIDFLGYNFSTRSIFLVNAGKINQDILSKFPIVEAVKINKNFPNSLILNITEKNSAGIYCQEEKCFLINQDGIIFEPSPRFVSDLIIISQTMQNKDIFAGENVIQKNIMDAIIKIEKNIKNNFQINLTEAFLSNPLRLNIKTSENWEIYFNLDSDVNSQLTKLNLLLQEQIAPKERKKLEYIDLRFKDRAYYK